MPSKCRIAVISAVLVLGLSFAAEIHDAAAAGDTGQVRKLLDANPTLLNLRNDNGMTPLCTAAHTNQPEIAAFLIKRGADPLIGDEDNSQPLHCAGISGSVAIAKMLLEDGVPVDARDNNDLTALHFACSNKRMEVVKLLLEHGSDVNAQTNRGYTPLMFGVLREDREMMELILFHGADLQKRSANGWTYLHYAAWQGKVGSLELLVERGLKDLDICDNEGTTPLGVAIAPTASAVKLIELGADVNCRNRNGETPLHGAARLGANETVKLLVEHGADVNATDNYGWTPLRNAAFTNSALVAYLVEKGADPAGGANSALKVTPLHIAAEACSLNSVRILVENGATVNVMNDRGQTPLYYAVANGRQEIVEYLLEHGAVVNARERFENRGLLHCAAMKGYDGIAKLLIKSGADPNARDDRGLKPSAYAAYHGFGDLDGLLAGTTQVSSSALLLEKPLKSGQAAVWYLGHSGWAVRTAGHLLIFDYFLDERSAVPAKASLASGSIVPAQLKDQTVTVFVSHGHGDHFAAHCFDWRKELPGIRYVLGFTPRDSAPAYTRMGPDQTKTVDGIEISTIRSADAGVAFLIKVDGLVIFHGGDHANADTAMTGRFPKDIDRLAADKVKIDLAFLGITGCSLGDPVSVRKGVHYAIQKLNPKALFPMHAMNRPDMYRVFAAEAKGKKYAKRIMCASDRGDAFLYKRGVVKPFPVGPGAK